MNSDDKILREKLEDKFDELFSDLDDELPNPDNEFDTIIFNDDNGDEVEFEFMDLIAYEGEKYVVLLPIEDCEDAGEVVILRLEGEDNKNKNIYASVDDEDTLMEIFNIFKDKFKDEFNFVD